MLFAVVSKMSKEGVLNNNQRGILKDMILEYDSRLVSCLQEYDRVGNKDRLYRKFLQIASSAERNQQHQQHQQHQQQQQQTS